MTEHDCRPPAGPPSGGAAWRCPTCRRRWVWSRRWVGGGMREGWTPTTVDLETRRLLNKAKSDRVERQVKVFLPVAALVLIALVVWVVLRATS